MQEIIFRISDDREDIVRIHDALYEYNLTKTGCPREDVQAKNVPDQLAVTAWMNNGATACGGIVFHRETAPGKIFVDYFFLDENVRGGGVGSRLWQEFETWAEKHGAAEINLTTNSFQAPEFYRRKGFEVIRELPLPQPLFPDNIKYYLRKIL